MKRILLGFGIVALMCAQPVMAGSSREGGEKQSQKQMRAPEAAAPGEMAPVSEMETTEAIPSATNAKTVIANTPSVSTDATANDHVAVTKSHHKPLILKLLDKKSTHEGSYTFGMLSLIFGVLGFVFAWFLWPLGLALALCAIIFGVIGLLGGRSGRGMAIAGLVLGFLTLLLPVLIYSWVMVL